MMIKKGFKLTQILPFVGKPARKNDDSPLQSSTEAEKLPVNFANLLSLVDERSRPNINALWQLSKDIEATHLNIKFFGYELARQLAAALPVRTRTQAQSVALECKASTQIDLESDWLAHWCGQLKTPVIFHRKVWEFAYVLQTLHDRDLLKPGVRGLGFGCGQEPIPSYLASLNVKVTVTDQAPDQAAATGWSQSNQHSYSLDAAFREHLVSREIFDRHVEFSFADMNEIPPVLADYDFCWSICAMEHLGSIEKGIDFVENSLKVLQPGGVSVHTTEYNFLNDDQTIDNWATVLFQRCHFQEIHDRLTASGHYVAPLNFNFGDKVLDKFIDIPPFLHQYPENMHKQWGQYAPHLKLNIDGFASTCFGLIVIKKS